MMLFVPTGASEGLYIIILVVIVTRGSIPKISISFDFCWGEVAINHACNFTLCSEAKFWAVLIIEY